VQSGEDEEDEGGGGVPQLLRATSSVQLMLGCQRQSYEKRAAEALLQIVMQAAADLFRAGGCMPPATPCLSL
jgi:hypothetical protein